MGWDRVVRTENFAPARTYRTDGGSRNGAKKTPAGCRRYRLLWWRLGLGRAAEIDYGERFEHADGAGLAFVRGDYKAERSLVRGERLAVDGVDDQDGFGGEIVVKFGYGEDGAVAVGAFGYDRKSHAFAAERCTLGHARFGQQCADGDAVVLMHLVVVALRGDGFAGELLQVVEIQLQVLGDSPGDQQS